MGDVSDESETARKPKRRIKLLLIVASVVLVLDVVTKVLAVRLLQPGKPVPIIGDTVTWTLVRNSGAAFSFATGYTWVLTLIAISVVVGILFIGRRLVSTWWAIGLGMILGGALGNLVDRFFRDRDAARLRGGLPVRGVVAGLQCRGPLRGGWRDSAGGTVAVRLRLRPRGPFYLETSEQWPGGQRERGPAGFPDQAVMTSRSLPVPDGLSGMRVDAGLARLLGLSRTAAAALAEEGAVLLDGVAVTKSEKLTAGTWLEVTLPEPKAPPENRVEVIEGMKILYADDDLVAVDKPAGVAAHASVGWTGPTVLGGLAAAGFRMTTSGVPERKGIVHRLDVGTSGVMVVALSEKAYTELKRAFKYRRVEKRYHALVQGIRIHPAAQSMRPSAGIAVTTGNLPWSRMVVIPSPTTTPLRRSWRPACSTYTWKPVARTRFECTSRR